MNANISEIGSTFKKVTVVDLSGREVDVALPGEIGRDALAGIVALLEVGQHGMLIVVFDEIDLPLGKLRIRPSGSAGTHNGMRSIVASLATERFPRLRFGVRGASYSDVPLRDYVLDDFTDEELPLVQSSVDRAVDALVLFARGDLKRAMNQFNRDPEPEPESKT